MFLELRKKSRGFTLIELLIVVAIVGMIAAILIPSMLEALQKSRQKRSMATMREIGLGMAHYWSDHAGAAGAGAVTVDVADWTGTATASQLADVLVPDYIPGFNVEDGWGRDLELRIHIDSPPKSGYAMMRSFGRDGIAEGDTYEAGAFLPSLYDQDMVWADGSFVRAPASTSAT